MQNSDIEWRIPANRLSYRPRVELELCLSALGAAQSVLSNDNRCVAAHISSVSSTGTRPG